MSVIKAHQMRVPTADTRAIKPPPKRADPFYLTPEWRRLVTGLIADRGRQCQECKRTLDRQGKPVRLFGDHVRELRDGGPLLDLRNVRLLCGACHTRKTAQARAARMSAPAGDV